MKLSIVIPAYNEEEAIAATIERTLAARPCIIADSPIAQVEIIVVSDGSTDRTAAIARGYGEISVIEFPRNCGYGAAIKKGFEASTGELVGFLDADGTCDPAFFSELCNAVVQENASVALGSRMHPQSRMPRLRRIGNRLYAVLLSLLSNRVVTDTASGMRVIRRDALGQLYPLPDGLHFTPAMSARVLMDEGLRLVERPMPYEERIGESKLHVVRDGVRFLRTIMEMTLMWQPSRLFFVGALLCLGLTSALALHPIETWLRAGRLREDMIYRLLFCLCGGVFGITLLSAGVICSNLARLWSDSSSTRTPWSYALDRMYSLGGAALAAAMAVPLLLALVGRGVWTRVFDGYVSLHWSRLMLAVLLAFTVLQIIVTTLIANLIRFHAARRPAHRLARAHEKTRRDVAVLEPLRASASDEHKARTSIR